MLNQNYKVLIGFTLLISLHSSLNVFGQVDVINKGVVITNVKSSNIHIRGSYINSLNNVDSSGKINNDGHIVIINGNIINNSKSRIFNTNAGNVVMNNVNSVISGINPVDFHRLYVGNNKELKLEQSIKVAKQLYIIAGNINLNGKDIDLSTDGILVNERAERRIYGDSGVIKAIRYLNKPRINDTIAGLGLCLQSNDNFGTTTIERGHSKSISNEDTSISRYFHFKPTYNGNIDNLTLTYFDNEKTGTEELYKVFISKDKKEWLNKGGEPDTANNYVISKTVSPPAVGESYITLLPIQNFSTCLPNDPNYISAIFLVSTEGESGEPLQFVELSTPTPNSYLWNFGDGNMSSHPSPAHTYFVKGSPENYEAMLTVSNNFCKDSRKKTIKIIPNDGKRNAGLYNGIVSVNVRPNPSTGNFMLDIELTKETEINVTLYNLQGILIESRNLFGSKLEEDFSLSSELVGVYLLKIQTGNQKRTFKIIKY